MTQPVPAQKAPYKVAVEAGRTYWWCACGLSAKQPFCDGAHKACSLRPLKVEVPEGGKRALCQCKHTKTPPFCDGSHCAL